MGNVFKGTSERRSLTNYGSVQHSKECPTCRGTGQLPDDPTIDGGSEYIALIPLTDKRLRPQRTVLKILATVMLCLTVSGLLLFFLLLRTVDLSSVRPVLMPGDVKITAEVITLNLSFPFNVSNWNYVPLYVESVGLLSHYHSSVLNNTRVHLDDWVPARGLKELRVNQLLTFSGPVFSSYLPKLCLSNNTYFNQIYISFSASVLMKIMGQHFESVLDTFQLVSCHPNTMETALL